VRATPRLYADYAVGRQRALANQEFRVFLRVNVVGDHGQVQPRPQPLAQAVNQRRLSAAHWTCYTHPKCSHKPLLKSEEKISLRERQLLRWFTG
jgi:hypothetical protein